MGVQMSLKPSDGAVSSHHLHTNTSEFRDAGQLREPELLHPYCLRLHKAPRSLFGRTYLSLVKDMNLRLELTYIQEFQLVHRLSRAASADLTSDEFGLRVLSFRAPYRSLPAHFASRRLFQGQYKSAAHQLRSEKMSNTETILAGNITFPGYNGTNTSNIDQGPEIGHTGHYLGAVIGGPIGGAVGLALIVVVWLVLEKSRRVPRRNSTAPSEGSQDCDPESQSPPTRETTVTGHKKQKREMNPYWGDL